MDKGLPTPPIISKYLSCYFKASFSLVQLVCSRRQVTLFSLVQQHGHGGVSPTSFTVTMDMQTLYKKQARALRRLTRRALGFT